LCAARLRKVGKALEIGRLKWIIGDFSNRTSRETGIAVRTPS
jgi:hypothetical protein